MERRFAIIIGINDYSQKPLDYCVKDANDIANILERSCNFDSNDIRIIKSSETNPQTNLSTLLFKAIDSIVTDFSTGKDSLFFFYSGHGEKSDDGGVLKFHDDNIQLQNIIDEISIKLLPKHEFYVIDACYSGEKIKGIENEQNELDIITTNKFSLKSESFNILAATRYDQVATEKREFQNGILTHFFLEAINTIENYNQFGFISPDIISNYVRIKVSLEKYFDQIPYSLNKNSGTFPFALRDSIITESALVTNVTEELENTKRVISEAPTVFFHYRLTDAFPGVREIQWFKDNIAIEGLKRLFEEPFIFDSSKGKGVVTDPIWWFRGNSACPVERFEDMTDGRLLFNNWELNIKKVAVFNGSSYWNNIIYVETYADSPTELCELSSVEIEEAKQKRTYVSEYFGISEGRYIKPEQAEDGGGIINGQYYKFNQAETRYRFLTPYNFIIVAKFSPANTQEGNSLGTKYMDEILKGNLSFEDFVEEYELFYRHISD